ncbi:type II toxin-antitoxin system ParD family antitoxin [Nevskia sp.]|uniref:type II toxin-antitoxin system ParD family antitoxin n=1 Tax=Nevskia sp. TaxID=1929292 RepID=UPI0025DD9928|nr:type II toxin-antitoxin system ParD family antitoxin [Nevskia sp.]
MPTRNVVLTDHQASLLEHLVRSGRYQNASEVLRDGLRLVESREIEANERLKALRVAAGLGIADADAGRWICLDAASDVETHFAKLEARLLDARESSKNAP